MLVGLLGSLVVGLLVYGLLFAVTSGVAALLCRAVFRETRIEPGTWLWYTSIALDGYLLGGFAGYAALCVAAAASDSSVWALLGLSVVGVIASFIAYAINSTSWGSTINILFLAITLLSYMLTALWAAPARLLYGWLFALLGQSYLL